MKIQRIRDPLHNLIEFHTDSELERVLWGVMATRPFQRLRRVKQLGFSDLVYPGASHSRFAHSVGVFHTARQLMGVVVRHGGERRPGRENIALAAALVHDLGHGPFSHAFEKVGKRLGLKLADHEHMSDRLIRDGEVAEALRPLGGGFANDVADIIKKDGATTIHNGVVSSQFDADRLDYMRRDRLMTGAQVAGIDFDWLIANLEIADAPIVVDDEQVGSVPTFALGAKALLAAEAYVLGLFQLYPTVYFHKATRGAEGLFTELLVKVVELVKEGSFVKTGLPRTHPLVRFALNPEDIEIALSLDDTVVWGALSLMAESEDLAINEFATRLRDRRLYKCLDVRSLVAQKLNPSSQGDPDLAEKIDRCCATIKESLTIFKKDYDSHGAVLLIDSAERSPYSSGSGSAGFNQINILNEARQLVDLQTRSQVVASLKAFQLFRVYLPDEAAAQRKQVVEIIDRVLKKCR